MLPSRLRGQWSVIAIAMIALLALSFAFGGASRVNALRLALVELAALPLLVLAASQFASTPGAFKTHRFILTLIAGCVLLPLIQLVPLPPGIWTGLPGREPLQLALELARIPAGWSPLSLTPVETWNAALALIPPVAVFVGLLLNREGPLTKRTIAVLLAFALINILLGALQFVSGDRRFYPYQSTQTGFITGLFANRNHLATLLLVSMPFAAAVAGQAIARRKDRARIYLMGLAAVFVTIMLALLAAQSRAGVALFVPSLLLSIAVVWRASRFAAPRPALLAVGILLVAGGLGFGALFLPPILARYEASAGGTEARFQRWPIAIEAGQQYLPVGAGIGSFDPVFRTIEPLEQLDATFFNHAHNEYLEIWIETGWIGVALLIAFFVWWGRRSWDVWFRSSGSSDRHFRQAASAAILICLIHSIVDYPLRTVALAVVFAMAGAILEVGGGVAASGREAGSKGRRVRVRQS